MIASQFCGLVVFNLKVNLSAALVAGTFLQTVGSANTDISVSEAGVVCKDSSIVKNAEEKGENFEGRCRWGETLCS